MKKIVVALAAVIMAAAVQAAMVDWKVTVPSTEDRQHTFMVFNASSMTAIQAALDAGGVSLASVLGTNALRGSDNVTYQFATSSKSSTKAGGSVGVSGDIFVVLFDGAIADGKTYKMTGAISTTGWVYDTQADPPTTSPGSLGIDMSALPLTTGTINNVPEPTSGLLLLLGVAGLALRRRRA